MIAKRVLLFVFILFVASQNVQGQDVNSGDSPPWLDNLVEQIKRYQMTGTYRPVSVIFEDSHPFFESPTWVEGVLHYMGESNANSRLIYDLFQDQIFMLHPDNDLPVITNYQLVDWFTLDEHYFEKVEGQTGYFELLFNTQSLKLYKKYRKTTIREYDEEIGYRQDEVFFVQHNDAWTRVSGKQSFTKLFPEFKKEINAFYKRTVRAKRGREKEEVLVLLAEFTSKNMKD